jgi:YD repeat-containing protein
MICFATICCGQDLDQDDIERKTAENQLNKANRVLERHTYEKDSTINTTIDSVDYVGEDLLTDIRYFLSKKETFDTKGKLIEEVWYSRNGTINKHKLYTYINEVNYAMVQHQEGGIISESTEYAYDSLNSCISIIFRNKDDSIVESQKRIYLYDESGSRIKAVYHGRYGESTYLSQYNEENREVSTAFESGRYSYQYNELGQKTTWTIESIQDTSIHFYKYDENEFVDIYQKINGEIIHIDSSISIGDSVQLSFRLKEGKYPIRESQQFYLTNGLRNKSLSIFREYQTFYRSVKIRVVQNRYEYKYF